MQVLKNGCRYSDFNLFPNNWKTTTSKSSLKKTWRIEYYFHDPLYKEKYPNGFRAIIKGGMGWIKDLDGRRQLMQKLIDDEKDLLENQAYNPITKTKLVIKVVNVAPSNLEVVDENTPFIKALSLGLESKRMDPESKKDIKSKLPHIEKAAKSLIYKGQLVSDIPISQINRKLIRMVLDKLGDEKGEKWTANNFNRYRTDLRIIFNELNELEAMEANPIDGLKKRKGIKKIRETMDLDDRIKVDKFLRENYYTLWRLLKVFFHAGCRETELLGVTFDHINLNKRWFEVLVKKDGEYRWDRKPIEPDVVNLWKEIMNEAEELIKKSSIHQQETKKLFLFSEGLRPMFRNTPIRQEQISRRWKTHVKDKSEQIGAVITADFYSLKHLRTTEDVNSEVNKAIKDATQKAAAKNGHKSSKMVEQVYDTESQKRLLELMKNSKVSFVPISHPL